MKVRLSFLVVFLILHWLYMTPAMASLTGTLSGKVIDEGGVALPGVSITVRGDNLQGARTAYTTANGAYRIPLLPPGKYTLVAELTGMNREERDNVELNINKSTTIDVVMKLATLEEIVVVTAEAPVLDTKSSTVGVNIDRSFTERLPQNDSFQSAFTMGSGSVGGSNPSVHGATVTDNVVMFDGIDATDPVTHTFAQNLNADAIEEVEVQTGGFQAEYGRALGGIVNAVTKTGGNEFEGIFRIKYETDLFNAPASPGHTAEVVDDNYEPTFSLGGPIMKDKLWFFLSYRFRQNDQNVDVRVGTDDEGEYLYEKVANDEIWQWGHANLTWNVTEKHNLQFTYTWDPAVLENHGDSKYSPEAQEKVEQGGNRYGLSYNYIVNSKLYLNAKIGTFDSYLYFGPQNDSGLPSTYDRTNKIYYDNYNSIDENDRYRTTGNLSATYFIENLMGGSHEVKAGIEYFYLHEKQYRNYTTGKFYETKDGTPFRYKEYVNGEGENVDQDADYYAFYIQDAWEAIPGLMIRPGVRFERCAYYNSQSENIHTFDMVVGPRFGFAYDIQNDGRSKLYASYGRYYKLDDLNIVFGDPGPTVVRNTWLYDPDNPDAGTDGYYLSETQGGEESNLLDENIKPEMTDEIIIGYDREVMRNFSVGLKGIYRYTDNTWEDIGFYQDENGTIYRVDEIDWNDTDTDGDGVPDDVKAFWDNSRTAGGWLITNPHGGYRRYIGISLSATAKTEKFMAEMSYTYSRAEGTTNGVAEDGEEYNTPFTGAYDDPYSSINLDGYLSYDTPHYIKIIGSYQLPWGLSAGTKTIWRSGYTYNKLIEQPDGMAGGRYIEGERGEYRMDDVVIIDFSLQKDLDFGKWGILTAIIDVTNVFDNQVELDVEYDYDVEQNRFGRATDWADPRQVEFQLKYAF